MMKSISTMKLRTLALSIEYDGPELEEAVHS